MQRLFKPESRRPGAWNDEQSHLKQELGPLGPILPLHMTPEARRGQYLVRADALLMAEGFLPPNTPEFALAQRVVAELVIAERPDVVLWTLKAFYPDNTSFQRITKGGELVAALQSGTIRLPADYRQKVDVLAQFDEFEAIGDPNQPTRKQTPLIPIIAEVAKAVRETVPAPQATGRANEQTKEPVPLPDAPPSAAARDVLGTLLNSELLTPDQRRDAREAYQQVVERAMGTVPTEAYRPRELPGDTTPIRLSEESQKDTVAHAENPGWSRNRQFGLIALTDAYFGGALELFSDSMQDIAARQLDALPYRHLHNRSRGIMELAENATRREQVGELLRERMRRVLTSDCTFGYEYVDRNSSYESRYASQRMLSDLPRVMDESSFMSGKSRGLYINVSALRTQMGEVRAVVQALRKSDGDYFDVLDRKLGAFIDGQFLKDADRFQTQTADDYSRKYQNQVRATLTGESPARHILYPGVEDIQRRLSAAIKNAPDGYYASSDRSAYLREISDALLDPAKTFDDPKKQEDLARARAVMAEVNPQYDDGRWRSTSLISPETSETAEQASLGEQILHSASQNKQEFAALGEVLQSMAFMYDMAELYSAIPEDRRPETPLWEPQKQGISLRRATHPYAVLRSVMAGGRPTTEMTEDELQWSDPVRHRGSSWPPSDTEYIQRDYDRHKADLRKAFGYITPIDIELTPDRPIDLIVGNNGSGKTFAMETLVQSLGYAGRTGLQPFAGEQRAVYTPTVRALINASRHQERISSYQSEIDLMISVIDDIKKRDPNSCAVWAIDEIGKGTDSRDALSLLFGTIEWARRNNVHFVVSTHYGRQFMEIAQMLGADGAIQIYTPNAETHELLQSPEITASHGVEVMVKMGRKNDIPPRLLDALAENALRLRAVHDTREQAVLAPIETVSEARAIQFAHEDDLADIGLSTANAEAGASGNTSFKMLPERTWGSPKTLLGRTLETSGYSSTEPPLKKTMRAVKNRWSGRFQREFSDVSLSEQAIVERKTHVREMVETATANREAFTAATRAMLETATGLAAASERVSEDKLTGANDRLQRFFDHDNPLTESIYLHSDGGQGEYDLFQVVSAPDVLAAHRRATAEAAAFLTRDGVPDYLRIRGARLARAAVLAARMEQAATIPPAEVSLKYNTAIARYLLQQIRSSMIPYSTYSTDNFKQYLPQMGELFQTTFQRGEDVFTFISERARNGDLSALITLNDWVQKQEIPRYSSGPLSTIKNSLGFFGQMQTGLTARLAKNDEALAAARTITELPDGTADDIAKKMFAAFTAGDCTLLDRILSIPKLDAKLSYSSSEDALKRLGRMHRALSIKRWTQWQSAIAERNQPALPENGADLYTAIGAAPDASAEQITQAIATAREKHTADEATLKLAAETLGTDKRFAYDMGLAAIAMDELQFLTTIASSVQEFGMCVPEHSADGSIDIQDGVSLPLATSLRTNYVPQSLHVDAGTNTVVIGGMNGGGKSQTLITMADIMAWDHFIGYVPAKRAVLPRADFIVSAINAGESIVGMSSFQNEITRYLKVLDRYVEAGCPQNGVVFLDEPLAGTSSEDQAGILISIVDFLQSRGVKVIMTNHNHAFYDVIRRTTGSNGEAIPFLPVAFGTAGSSRYQLQYFKSDETEKIRSRGIDVAEERGVDPSIIKVARQVRKLIDQVEEAKGRTHA